MEIKLQIAQPLEILHSALTSYLKDFESTHRRSFKHDFIETDFGIHIFKLRFSRHGRVWISGEDDLGHVSLRRLNTSLTELRIIDSCWLDSTPQKIMDEWSWYIIDPDLSQTELEKEASATLNDLRSIHENVRNFIIEHLKEDRILSSESSNPLKTSSRSFVDETRITQLRQITCKDFDLSKLIRLCEELNYSFSNGCYYATAALVRTLIDHVPPIFGVKSFKEYANNVAGKSIKTSIQRLDNSSRDIADAALHQQMQKREVIPTATQVDFSNDLDILLGEIIRKLT